MISPLRKLALALAAVSAVLALSACGDSHTKVTTGTYAGESGVNAPYLDVGPLSYEVQLSRELNPTNSEDSTYLQGLGAEESKLEPGQEWFMVSLQVYNKGSQPLRAATNITITDTQGNVYSPIVPGAGQPVRLPRRDRAGERAVARARHDPPTPARRRERCCSSRSKSSRSTTVRSR